MRITRGRGRRGAHGASQDAGWPAPGGVWRCCTASGIRAAP